MSKIIVFVLCLEVSSNQIKIEYMQNLYKSLKCKVQDVI